MILQALFRSHATQFTGKLKTHRTSVAKFMTEQQKNNCCTIVAASMTNRKDGNHHYPSLIYTQLLSFVLTIIALSSIFFYNLR